MKNREKIKVVHYRMDSNKYIYKEIKEVEDSLEDYKELIDGHLETYPLTDKLIIVCDEEGKIKQKEPRAVVFSVITRCPEVIVGDFFVCRRQGENFASVQDKDMELIDLLVATDLKFD